MTSKSNVFTHPVRGKAALGLGAAVWHNGRTLWTGETGYRDVARKLPVEAQTIFRLASVSKLLTVTAAARLRERAAFDVDAPIAMAVPAANGWPALTARQLAAHISGMPHYQDVDENRGGRRYASVDEAVDIFKGRPLLSAPGTRYNYSSWGYTLLSAAIERHAKMRFSDYVASQITPGLAIGLDPTGSGNSAVSVAYEFVDGQARPAAAHDFSYTWAGGGFAATPRALAEFGAE